jgi:hypothetical protein
VLRKKANFAARLDVARRSAKNLSFAARGEYQAQQHFDGGAFTRTVWSQKAKDLTPRNSEGEVSDCHFAAKDFAKSTGADREIVGLAHVYRFIGIKPSVSINEMDQRNEAASARASDELPCPAREWITPFLIHNRLYRFPCVRVSVIRVPWTPSTLTVS